MSTQLLTDLSAALSEQLAPELIKNFNRVSVVSGLFAKKTGAGENLSWGTQFSGASAASFSEGADVSTYDQDVNVQAVLAWGMYRSSFAVSGLAQAAAQSANGSPAQLMAIIADNANNSIEKLANVIELACFSSSSGIIGLDSALAASGTYAGISKATYTEWAGNVLAVSGELSKSHLDQIEASVFDASGLMPNAIVASSAVCRKYEGLFDSMMHTAPGVQNVGAMGAMANGFTGLSYKGMPVYRARNATAGYLYMLNTNMIDFVTLPQGRVNTAMMGSDQSAVAGGQNTGINVRVEALAKTGDADKFTVKVYAQLKVKRPNAHGMLTGISTT